MRLRLHDVSGRRIALKETEFLAAGWHVVRWDPGRVAAGVYFLRRELDSCGSAVARCVMLD